MHLILCTLKRCWFIYLIVISSEVLEKMCIVNMKQDYLFTLLTLKLNNLKLYSYFIYIFFSSYNARHVNDIKQKHRRFKKNSHTDEIRRIYIVGVIRKYLLKIILSSVIWWQIFMIFYSEKNFSRFFFVIIFSNFIEVLLNKQF